MDDIDPSTVDPDELIQRAALRKQQLEKFKQNGRASDQPATQESPANKSTQLQKRRFKENVNLASKINQVKEFVATNGSGDDSMQTNVGTVVAPHTKHVLAQMADLYETIDEEDSHSEGSVPYRHSLRHPSHAPLTKPPTPQKSAPKSPFIAVSSPDKHLDPPFKREHVASLSSPILHPAKVHKVSEMHLLGSPRKSVDPAEMSIIERKALFEKAAESDDSMRSSPRKPLVASTSPATIEVRRALFESAAAASQKPSMLKKTSTASITSPRKEREAFKEADEDASSSKDIGVHTRTLQDKLLEQRKAWRHNDISHKIQEQKQEDMKILRSRWELMAEEERRAAERAQLIGKLAEKKKAGVPPPSIVEGPPPLPLPGHSSLHEAITVTCEPRDISTSAQQCLKERAAETARGNCCISFREDEDVFPPPPSPLKANEIAKHGARLPEEEGFYDWQETRGKNVNYDADDDMYDIEVEDELAHANRAASSACVARRAASLSKSPRRAVVQQDVSDTSSEDADNSTIAPISLSFYRKTQREQKGSPSPCKEVSAISVDVSHKLEERRLVFITSCTTRIQALESACSQQHEVMLQTSSAMEYAKHNPPPEYGTTLRAECERILLLAGKKRDSYQAEASRLRHLLAQITHSPSLPDHSCRGQVTLFNMVLPTKEGFLEYVASETQLIHYFVLILRHRDSVYASEMVNSVQHLQSDGTFHFPGQFPFKDLETDMIITVDAYAVQANQELHHHHQHHKTANKKEKSATLKRFLKFGKEQVPTSGTPSKQSLRASSFGCVGTCYVTLSNLRAPIFHFTKLAEQCALEGSMRLEVNCSVSLDCSEEGFLTFFEDCCGPTTTAWHRRWCLLQQDTIYMWRYPEEKDSQAPQELCLRYCDGQAENVSTLVCPRPNTFQLNLTRALRLAGDPRSAPPYRYLVSAERKEERFIWCEKINKILTALQTWLPDT